MNYNQVFYITNIISLLSWCAIIFFPNAKYTKKFVKSHMTIILLALIYFIIAIMAVVNQLPGGFSSLSKVSLMLSNDLWVLGAWVHFLAFDLFVGLWILKDSNQKGYSHLSVIPFLILCLLFGPIGFLFYKIKLRIVR